MNNHTNPESEIEELGGDAVGGSGFEDQVPESEFESDSLVMEGINQ